MKSWQSLCQVGDSAVSVPVKVVSVKQPVVCRRCNVWAGWAFLGMFASMALAAGSDVIVFNTCLLHKKGLVRSGNVSK